MPARRFTRRCPRLFIGKGNGGEFSHKSKRLPRAVRTNAVRASFPPCHIGRPSPLAWWFDRRSNSKKRRPSFRLIIESLHGSLIPFKLDGLRSWVERKGYDVFHQHVKGMGASSNSILFSRLNRVKAMEILFLHTYNDIYCL